MVVDSDEELGEDHAPIMPLPTVADSPGMITRRRRLIDTAFVAHANTAPVYHTPISSVTKKGAKNAALGVLLMQLILAC